MITGKPAYILSFIMPFIMMIIYILIIQFSIYIIPKKRRDEYKYFKYCWLKKVLLCGTNHYFHVYYKIFYYIFLFLTTIRLILGLTWGLVCYNGFDSIVNISGMFWLILLIAMIIMIPRR